MPHIFVVDICSGMEPGYRANRVNMLGVVHVDRVGFAPDAKLPLLHDCEYPELSFLLRQRIRDGCEGPQNG